MEKVTLTVYNLLGQRVARLLSEQRLAAGPHAVVWHAGGEGSGVYLYRIETPTHRASRKMLLIK